MHGFERTASERGRWLGAPRVHGTRPPEPGHERIVVIRALRGLGDMLCVVPALRSLRAGAPDAHITCLGVPAGRWMLERYPQLIDAWLDLPAWPTIPEATGDPADTVRLLASVGGRFDLAVQLQGSGGPINRLAEELTSDVAAVHVQPRERVIVPDDRAVFARRWPTHGHEIERMAGLVRALGFPDTGTRLEFPVHPDDHAALPSALARPRRPIAVVHPGASRPDRRWSPDGFTAVARHLHHHGYQVVITGTSAELGVVGAVADGCTVGPWVLLDAPLGALAALLRRATVLVANDTGVAHLGVAVDVPTMVVGTTSDLERWGPIDQRRHATVRTTGQASVDLAHVTSRLDRMLAERRRGTALAG